MMKTNNTPRAVAALCIAFALSPIAMSAQTFPGTTPVTTTTSDTTYNRGEREEHHDYGWIGLLGLTSDGRRQRARNVVAGAWSLLQSRCVSQETRGMVQQWLVGTVPLSC